MTIKWTKALRWKSLTRKFVAGEVIRDPEHSLARVMGLFDLVSLGIGATLGLGPFVLVGEVAKTLSGPAVCIAYIVSGIAAGFSAMCYAEFTSRVPRAGSAYVYTYVTVGEFVAFTIGWNLILEYALGSASIGRGLSDYIDVLLDNKIHKWQQTHLKIGITFLGQYFDLLALSLMAALTGILLFGVKESFKVNRVLAAISLVSIIIMVIAGATKADFSNWKRPAGYVNITENRIKHHQGGFFAFGAVGVFEGAAKCFYAYVGFDAVTSSAEEAKNPKRNIPLTIAISFVIIFLSNFGLSIVLTLIWPFDRVDDKSPFPTVFNELHMPAFAYISSIGAISAFVINIMGMMFPLPRVLYSMGNDGLLFRFFSIISKRTKLPYVATIACGLFAGTMALIFDTAQLVDMMSIGTLLAFTIVATSVLILRYQVEMSDEISSESNEPLPLITICGQFFNCQRIKEPSKLSSSIVKYSIMCFGIMSLIWGYLFDTFVFKTSGHNENVLIAVWITLGLFASIMILLVIIIGCQPKQKLELTFTVPLLPVIPCCSVFLNLYLMLQLETWTCFGVWVILGLIMYFTYGITHSSQGERNRKRKQQKEVITLTDKFTLIS